MRPASSRESDAAAFVRPDEGAGDRRTLPRRPLSDASAGTGRFAGGSPALSEADRRLAGPTSPPAVRRAGTSAEVSVVVGAMVSVTGTICSLSTVTSPSVARPPECRGSRMNGRCPPVEAVAVRVARMPVESRNGSAHRADRHAACDSSCSRPGDPRSAPARRTCFRCRCRERQARHRNSSGRTWRSAVAAGKSRLGVRVANPSVSGSISADAALCNSERMQAKSATPPWWLYSCPSGDRGR